MVAKSGFCSQEKSCQKYSCVKLYRITSAKYRLLTPRNRSATIRNRLPGPWVPYRPRGRGLFLLPNLRSMCPHRRNRICPRSPDSGPWLSPQPLCRCPPLGSPVASHSITFRAAQSGPVTLGRSSFSARIFRFFLFLSRFFVYDYQLGIFGVADDAVLTGPHTHPGPAVRTSRRQVGRRRDACANNWDNRVTDETAALRDSATLRYAARDSNTSTKIPSYFQ